jgi:hypothetical protein
MMTLKSIVRQSSFYYVQWQATRTYHPQDRLVNRLIRLRADFEQIKQMLRHNNIKSKNLNDLVLDFGIHGPKLKLL